MARVGSESDGEERQVSPQALVVSAPDVLWRVGRLPTVLESKDHGPLSMADSSAGNRFDSATGQFGVRYLGSTLQTCLGESLAPLRPKNELAALVAEEWRERGWMEVGAVPSDWRHRRRVAKVHVATNRSFLNLESRTVISGLDTTMRAAVVALGYDRLDVSILRGPDRRVTRLLADYVWSQRDPDGSQRFAGIQYLSRHNSDWECWAAFDHTPLTVVELATIEEEMPELQEVAACFGLQVF